jgi:hypothetical protein
MSRLRALQLLDMKRILPKPIQQSEYKEPERRKSNRTPAKRRREEPHKSESLDLESTTCANDFLLNFRKAIVMALEDRTTFGKDCSLWEAILLEWACWTGEMCNHQALAAHKDGNRSHPMETLTLFGRKRVEDPTDDACRIVREYKDGMLALPYQHAVLYLEAAVDVWHVGLKNTIHVPDRTRDTDNWTKVHGP